MPALMDALSKTWTWLGDALAKELRSIRGRLLLTLAGLLVVLLALELFQHIMRLQQRQELAQKALQHTATQNAALVSSRVGELFSDQELILHALARVSDQKAYLADVRARYPGLQWIALLQPSRTPIEAVAPNYPGADRGNLADQLRGDNAHFISGVMALEGTTRPIIRLMTRLPAPSNGADQKDEAGVVLAMEFDAGQFPQLFVLTSEQGSGDLVLDKDSRLVMSRGEFPDPAKAGQNFHVQQALKGNVEGAAEFKQGRRDLHGYVTHIENTPWALLHTEGEEAILAGLDREIWRLFLVPVTVAIILGLALNLLLKISVRPLNRLSAATRTIGTGDLGVRLEKPEVEEFEAVVSAFNTMAERLELIQLALLEANEKLEEDKEQLDQRVKSATAELQSEHERLIRAERLSTLGLFSSAIAHDLRNPLNTVSLSLEWLRARLGESADERVAARLDTIRRELRRADLIIRTLLGFARTGELEIAPTDLNALIREVAEVVDPPRNVALRLDLDESLSPVPADRAQMFQVLENLVRNAIQAMPEGGEVRLSSRANCEYCHVRISDTGPGIPEEAQEKIWEPLVTGKSTGTGIGLALARRIVEAHHGHIKLESRPGEGALFDIELPSFEPTESETPGDQ
jgi:signal transduction histidine kinase